MINNNNWHKTLEENVEGIDYNDKIMKSITSDIEIWGLKEIRDTCIAMYSNHKKGLMWKR